LSDVNCSHPELLPKEVIEEVNVAINEIGGKYNYENYTVSLSEYNYNIIMKNILSLCLPTHHETKSTPKNEQAKLNKLKKNPSTHRMAINGRGHIPDKITG